MGGCNKNGTGGVFVFIVNKTERMRYIIYLLAVVMGWGLTACIDDSISTSPGDVLSFSRETVDFDTVFTGIGTPTARLVVYNRNKKGVNISSIRFKRSDTEFSMNVDGVSGSEFHDVEIRAKDSVYVFIECHIPESAGNSPALVWDEIEFVTNGVAQGVRVEAYGQNVTRLRNVRVSSDLTLTADRPYVVFDSLTVEKGAVLSIEPGARVLFHDGASLVVEGRLNAVGAAGRMIEMRGDRLDNVLPDVGYDILAGQWKGVRIAAGSYGNRMEYVDMRSTARGVVLDLDNDPGQLKLTVFNSWLHNSQGNVLSAANAWVECLGACFSEAGKSVVSFNGGKVLMRQCTVANNYLFAGIDGALVELLGWDKGDGSGSDDIEGEQPVTPLEARFENCIVYGLAPDLNVGDFTGTDVVFSFVSFNAEGNDDDNFLNCQWDTDPMFLTDRPAYRFDYRLAEGSPVAASGDPEYASGMCRFDMTGADRLGYGQPSLGAYQYVPGSPGE